MAHPEGRESMWWQCLRRPRGAWAVLLVLSALVSGAACDQEPGDDEARVAGEAHRDPGSEHKRSEEAISLSPDLLEEFGIEITTAGPGIIERTASLPAEVRANQNTLAHIAPRFRGIVREVRADIGDVVKSGQVLAIIESESLAPYSLKTLIGGVVIAKHITRGEPVSPDAEVFVVADLTEVWIHISVYQKDLPLIRMGQRVEVSAGHGLHEAEGEISYIAPVIDEETRTAAARVVLPNPDGLWRPGLFVTVRIEVDRAEVPVAVPRTALQRIDGETVVFVEQEDGFVPRRIETRRQGEGVVEVVSGLAPDERYVSAGGFALKAELSREESSSGHGH
jgi:cobalt-zinc-cadmium efflux system membrane fusion protein